MSARPEIPKDAIIAWEPNPGQQMSFLQNGEREALFGGAAGGGKLLPLDTPIPTPSGWKLNGDLQDGDIIFDECGKPCRVIKAFDPETPVKAYRFTFDDGSTLDSGPDHKWQTFDSKELAALTRLDDDWRARRRAKRKSRAGSKKSAAFRAMMTARNKIKIPPKKDAPTGSIRTSQEIADTLYTWSGRANHAVKVAGALELPEVELVMHPYVLGVWLGDGRSNGGQITAAEHEGRLELEKCGVTLRRQPSMLYGYAVPELIKGIRALGLYNNKHIPQIYMRASIAQRTALLQGLMDSDGYCSKSGKVEFCNTNARLATQVYELAISLGEKVGFATGRATLYGKDCGEKYRVTWTPKINCFRIPRKAARVRKVQRRTNQFRYIVGCESIKPVPMRCIAVDSQSHLYLAGKEMIPTHNSDGLLMCAVRHYKNRAHRAIIFRKTFPELKDLIERSRQIYPYLGGKYSKANGWRFPSGAIVEFGYLDKKKDIEKYKRAWNFIGFDELTHWEGDGLDKYKNPINSNFLYLISSRLRTVQGSGLPLEVRSTTNPGHAGHKWVRKRYNIPDDGSASEVWDEERQRWRVFIPSRISDCPQLAGTSYETDLDDLPENLRKMLKDGRWDVIEGAQFSEFDHRKHVCDPFALPQGTRIWRGADDGYNAPAWVGWFAEVDQRIYVIQELYRNKMTPEIMSEEVLRMDKEIQMVNRLGDGVTYNREELEGVIDAAAFNDNGGDESGTGRADKMNLNGLNWTPAFKGPGSRLAGCMLVHQFLRKILPDNKPAIQFFNTCPNVIRVISSILVDKKNPEDVDSTGEDHPYDGIRYGLQMRKNFVVIGKVRGL